MNYSYLVESGKYKKEDLSERSKIFVEGIEYAVEQIELAKENLFDGIGITDIPSKKLRKIILEIQNDAADQIKEWVEKSIDEVIVIALDSEYEGRQEDDSKEGGDQDAEPEMPVS